MTIFDYNRPRNGLFSSFLKIDKRLRNSSLIVIMIGVFLLPKTAYLSTITPEKIIEATNKERNKASLSALISNPLLEKAALAKAEAILDSQNFDHEIGGRRFSAWVKDSGYQYSIVGENLAIDFVTSEGVLKAWLNSPDHKKNIYNEEYQEIGVAVIEGNFQGQGTIVVAQIFGTPLKNTETSLTPIFNNQEPDIFQSGFIPWLAKQLIPSRLSLPLLTLNQNKESVKILSFASIQNLKIFF
jgi:hypothetical protein